MAGSYPDVPSRRMAWDADGSIGFQYGVSPITPVAEMSAANRAEVNDEDNTDALNRPTGVVTNAAWWFGVIFPELRELDGVFAALDSFTLGAMESSADTTNGIDGTWTQRIADMPDITDVYGDYRDQIQSLAVNSQRAIRIKKNTGGNPYLRGLHIYGTISAGETPDRLLWIDDDTGLEFTASLDYGDVPRGSARDHGVKIKNNSGSLTANTIQYTTEALYLSLGAYTVTTPGGSSFSSTQQIASLGAGATTGLITLRQIIPDAATLGLHAARLYTDVTSWS